MPAKLKIDWSIAKDLYCNGMTAQDVADQMGIKCGTLQNRAKRENWSKDRALSRIGARVIQPSSITELMNSEVQRWIKGAVRLTQRITDLANRTPVKPDLKQLRDATAVLEGIIKSGRAMFGLDKAQPVDSKLLAPTVQVGITLVSQAQSQPSVGECQAIDVDSQAVSASSVVTDNHNAGEKDPLDADDVASATGRDLSSPDL
jgi:hypothetical protein